MSILNRLLSNNLLICACSAWLLAQVIKTVLYAVLNHDFDWRRMFGDGGMPSAHSATVAALATRCVVLYGFESFEFAVTFILAVIVMHDAMGVRQETGKQTVAIKEIASLMEELGKDVTNEDNLKELVGHSLAQVLTGTLLGITVSLMWPLP